MKQEIKEEINKLYSLFKTTPKLNVKNTQQHIQSFAYNKTQINPLRRAVNKVISSGRCAFCNASKATVQGNLRNDLSKKEYKISALCQQCQDEVFTTIDKNSRFKELEERGSYDN